MNRTRPDNADALNFLSSPDKQLLIETDTLAHRMRAFTAILDGASRVSGIQH